MSSIEPKFGAVFPISSENVIPLFDQGRTVFAKYTKFKELAKGSKIVFYVSKVKKLIGEGTVEKVEVLNPEIAWVRYGKQMFLNETEYNRYVAKSPINGGNRKMVQITVFILKNLKKYRDPAQPICVVPPSGCYLVREKYQRIRTA